MHTYTACARGLEEKRFRCRLACINRKSHRIRCVCLIYVIFIQPFSLSPMNLTMVRPMVRPTARKKQQQQHHQSASPVGVIRSQRNAASDKRGESCLCTWCGCRSGKVFLSEVMDVHYTYSV